MKKSLRFFLKVLAGLFGLLVLLLVALVLFGRQKPAKLIALTDTGGVRIAAHISEIASSSALPGVLLAGSSGYGGTVIYSLDGGQTWQTAPSLPWDEYYSPENVILAPEAGPAAPGDTGSGVPSPSMGAWFNIMGSGAIGDPQRIVYRISPGHKKWSQAALGACPAGLGHETLAGLKTSPADPHRVFLTRYCDDMRTQDRIAEIIHDLVVEGYVSQDGGRSFQRVSEHRIRFDPAESLSVWEQNFDEVLLPSLVNAQQVYRGAKWVSEDGGQNWVETDFPVEHLVLDGVDVNRLYGTRTNSSHATVGLTRLSAQSPWKAWAQQPCPNLLQLVAHPTQTGVLYARCPDPSYPVDTDHPLQRQALMRSTDAGEHWQVISQWMGRWIGPDYGLPGRLLWARDDGLWSSTDLGDTWTQVTPDYQTEPRRWANQSPPDSPQNSVVAVVSPTDIWLADSRGWLQHWNGQTWQRIDYPAEVRMRIHGLAFSAPDDGWMVGEEGAEQHYPGKILHGVIYHWDGRRWAQSGPLWNDFLYGVTVMGEQAWAVGEDGIILRWDGQSWSEMPNPLRVPSNKNNNPYGSLYSKALLHGSFRLTAISMLSAEEGWAVGGTQPDGTGKSYILHYRQGQWQIEYDSGDTRMDLRDIRMLSPGLGWAVGYGRCEQESSACLLHWDGSAWGRVPNLSGGLDALAVLSTDDAWAGGSNALLHWDGKAWAAVPISEASSYKIEDLAGLPGGPLWVSFNPMHIGSGSALLRYTGGDFR